MENKKIISTYSALVVITVLALFIIKFFNISYPLEVTNSTTSNELSVVGEGKVDVVPDTAYVNVGITVNNKSNAKEAQNSINTINNNIIQALDKLGIPKKNIKTTNYSVYPEYDYNSSERTITGYNGNATLEVKTDKIDLAGQVVDITTENGANEIQGTRFEVNNPEKYREEARNKAIENAKEQAEKLAGTLGIKLGKVVNVIESSSPNSYQPLLESKMMAADGRGGGSSSSFEPGNQTITSVVTLFFEKK
jgi:uncharacterized protein YggE